MQSSSSSGSFVPTSNIWDVSNINSVKGITPELRELLVRLYQNLNRISIALNTKDSGIYTLNEFITGQTFFPNPTLSSQTMGTPAPRQTCRTVVNFGALPNTTTKSVPHNINPTNGFSFTRIYGAATNPTAPEYIPLPYASATLVNNIELYVDATNVNITTAANYSAYTTSYIILEYIKS